MQVRRELRAAALREAAPGAERAVQVRECIPVSRYVTWPWRRRRYRGLVVPPRSQADEPAVAPPSTLGSSAPPSTPAPGSTPSGGPLASGGGAPSGLSDGAFAPGGGGDAVAAATAAARRAATAAATRNEDYTGFEWRYIVALPLPVPLKLYAPRRYAFPVCMLCAPVVFCIPRIPLPLLCVLPLCAAHSFHAHCRYEPYPPRFGPLPVPKGGEVRPRKAICMRACSLVRM